MDRHRLSRKSGRHQHQHHIPIGNICCNNGVGSTVRKPYKPLCRHYGIAHSTAWGNNRVLDNGRIAKRILPNRYNTAYRPGSQKRHTYSRVCPRLPQRRSRHTPSRHRSRRGTFPPYHYDIVGVHTRSISLGGSIRSRSRGTNIARNGSVLRNVGIHNTRNTIYSKLLRVVGKDTDTLLRQET